VFWVCVGVFQGIVPETYTHNRTDSSRHTQAQWQYVDDCMHALTAYITCTLARVLYRHVAESVGLSLASGTAHKIVCVRQPSVLQHQEQLQMDRDDNSEKVNLQS
jgi:hypothetical protein